VKIIMTGASGLIGQAVAERLSTSAAIISLGRRPPALPAKVEHIEADLSSESFARRLPHRADAVIHLAQSERYAAFPEAADEIFAINVAAIAKLLNWARGAGVTSFVHTSTGGLYGQGPLPFKETDPIRIDGQIAFYFRTKQVAEVLAAGYHDYFAVVTLRPFFVYGPRQKEAMLVPRLINCVRGGTPVAIAGSDGVRLNPVHVSDAARSVERSLTLGESETINVAGPEILSLRAMAQAIGQAVGRNPVFEISEAPCNDLIGDTSRMAERLVRPEIRFSEAVHGLLGAHAT
jgi:UDP-glucose 4-epimerase